MKSISAVYNGSTKPGTVVDKSNIAVTGHYSDGSQKELNDWTIDNERTLKAGRKTTVKIEYEDKSVNLEIEADEPRRPEISGRYINCTAEEFIEYLDYTTSSKLTIKEIVTSKEDNLSIYGLYLNGNLDSTVSFILKDDKIKMINIQSDEATDLYVYILKNIINEFLIYDNKLNNIGLDVNKLFAIVVYKIFFQETLQNCN